MIRKLIALLLCGLGISMLVRSASAEGNGNPVRRITPPKPIYVYLNFEGDPSFPSITVQHYTSGLQPFTGSAFRLNATERDLVVGKVSALIKEDFEDVNVEFITDVSGTDSYYTWGIDDSTYIFDQDGTSHRLYGRSGGNPGKLVNEMTLYDANGNPIWHPKYGRTFAGSFALTPGNPVQSDPPLIPPHHCTQNEINDWDCGNLLQAGAGTKIDITLDHIAQAIANNAAQEIAQFFGAADTDDGTIMHAQIERTEAGTNKVFDNDNHALLSTSIGAAPELTNNHDGTVTDTRTGIMWAREANLAVYWPSACAGPTYGGEQGWEQMDWSSAQSYANCLDLAGYKGWRLPSALNRDGGGPCGDHGRIACEWPYRYGCFDGDFGDLYYKSLGNKRGNTSCYSHSLNAGPFVNIQSEPYWTGNRLSPQYNWVFNFQSGEQYPYYSQFSHSVWPARIHYRLIDNGDGTITDTSTGLMWAQNADVLNGTLSWNDATNQTEASVHAGYDDWRLPRVQAPDGTCSDTKLFSGSADRMRDCSRGELTHLLERWRITPADSSPFSLPAHPYSELRFWTERQWAADTDQAWVVYSTLAGGITDVADKEVSGGGYAWLVREIDDGDTYAGSSVRVEPHADVSLTFGSVTVKGSTTVSVAATNPYPDSPAPVFFGSFFDIATTAQYPDAGRVTVCIRYEHADLPDLGSEADIMIWQWQEDVDPSEWVDITSRFYPDTRNNVLCGATDTLSWFALGVGEPAPPDTGLEIESHYLVPAAGVYEVFEPEERVFAVWLEYRPVVKDWYVKPFGGLMGTSEGSVYGYAGGGVDVLLDDHVVLTPNVAVGAYEEGNGKDLGGTFIFRLGMELSYLFDDRARIGLALHHMSNLGIYSNNPGAETMFLTYSRPLGR